MDALLIPTFFCPKAWAGMAGDETKRYCTYCQKHVHNLESLSVSERLALLSSPTASICSRYRIAIRRPAKGKEEPYMRHLLKYGASVAASSSVLLVLWEVRSECENRTFYRAVSGLHRALTNPDWPDELYEERSGFVMGGIGSSSVSTCAVPAFADDPAAVPDHVDLDLNPAEVDQLLQSSETPPAAPLALVSPTAN